MYLETRTARRFLKKHAGKDVRGGQSHRCYTVPQPWHLSMNNYNWQVMEMPERGAQTLYLYGAYYDDRMEEETGRAAIRMAVMTSRLGSDH